MAAWAAYGAWSVALEGTAVAHRCAGRASLGVSGREGMGETEHHTLLDRATKM